MAKSEMQKVMDQHKKIAQETKIREYAKAIVDVQLIVAGFRMMDADSETMLQAILDQYDGNDNNHVGFRSEGLHRSLAASIAVQFEKLKMYGILSSAIDYPSGGILTLSEAAKTTLLIKKLLWHELKKKKLRSGE